MEAYGKIFWLTGLSGSGKTTIAIALSKELNQMHFKNAVLDGDILRSGLSSDLGFTDLDRSENVRRTSEIAKILVEQGFIVIVALISPFRKDRELARKNFRPGNFIEIYLNADIEICKSRDVKGLYKQAINKEIDFFTGLDSEYEKPLNPEMEINIIEKDIKQSIKEILNYGA